MKLNQSLFTTLLVLSVFSMNYAQADLVQQNLDNILIDDNPQWNEEVDDHGREYKAEEAEKDSGKGKGVALATGIALIATGTPMAASPIIPVKIAGIDLITKGIIELAQSAADSGTESENKGQKDLLLDAEGDIGDPLQANNQGLYIPEDLKNAIQGLGANPDEVAQLALSGDENAIRGAFGLDPSMFSDEDLAASQGLVDDQLNGLFDERASDIEEEPGIKLTVDEEQEDEALGGDSIVARGLGPNSLDGEQNGDLSAGDGVHAGAVDGGGSVRGVAGSGGAGAVGKSGGVDVAGMLNGLRGRGKKGGDALSGFSAAQLLRMGIRKRKRGQNIFTIASYNYRRFDGWRRGKKSKKLRAPKVSFRR